MPSTGWSLSDMARAGLTPERLTQAGAEMADEVGFEQVSISALARHFGVKAASLYSHLKSSQELKTRIALLALDEMANQAADAVAGRSGHDALVAVANVYRDYARTHPGRYAASRMRLDPEVAAVSAGPRHSQMMRAMLRGYGLTDLDQTHAVRLLGSFFHGYASLESVGAFSHSTPDSEDSWSRILGVLDSTLTNWPHG